MRRAHFIVGLLALLAFVLSGQVLRLHQPPVHRMPDGPHMVFVSRHIYLLGAGLLNLALGLYLRLDAQPWRRRLQWAGSLLILLAPAMLVIAFAKEPEHGVAGRTPWSGMAIFVQALGILAHLLARLGAARIDTTPSGH